MTRDARQSLEAILFVAEDPIDVATLAEVLELATEDVEDLLVELAAELERDHRGVVLRRVAGGWRPYTAPAAYPAVERFMLRGRRGRLSQAALETLAVIAYRQPISRQAISDIRGVSADGAVRTLVARGWVEEVARDDGPGQALLYGTTSRLLEQLGLDTVADLPPLTDFLVDGTAPDEPAPGEFSSARARLAAAADRIRQAARQGHAPDDDRDDDSADGDSPDGAAPVLSRRDVDDQLTGLSDQLDAAAEAAMRQLRHTVDAMERPADGDAADGEVADRGAGADGAGHGVEDAGG